MYWVKLPGISEGKLFQTSPEGEHIMQPLKGGAHCQPHKGGHPLGGGTTTSADTRR